MCGFVGFANLKENISSKTNIYNMNESISKRGPDEDGYYYEEHICLGHKRLIVVDPDGGKQPMSAMKDGNLYIKLAASFAISSLRLWISSR